MDTINVKFTFKRDLTTEEIQKLGDKSKHRYIEKITSSRSDSRVYHIGFSVPKYFSPTNAYLVRSKDFDEFKHHILDLFEPITISAIVTRVDTPFTFWMKYGESFHDYFHIFKFMSLCYSTTGNNFSTKYYADALTDTSESFILGDQTNLNKSNTKITIYDQNKKLYDFDSTTNKTVHQKLLESTLDLPRRIRVEVSRKTQINFGNLDYKDQYQKAYNYLVEHIFDEEIVEICKRELHDDYTSYLDNYTKVIHQAPVFDYDIFRDKMKNIYGDTKKLENEVTKLRNRLRIYKKEGYTSIRIKKVLPSMLGEFKNQITW